MSHLAIGQDPSEGSLLWRLQQDLEYIKQNMVTKAEMRIQMEAKQDKGVSEERWREVHADIEYLKRQMEQRPHQQTQNFFQAAGCSINALYLLVAGGSLFVGLAGVAVAVFALLKP